MEQKTTDCRYLHSMLIVRTRICTKVRTKSYYLTFQY
jgi:hypothetical protein